MCAIAGPIECPRSVQSPGMVVGAADAGQRYEYRCLVLAVLPVSRPGGCQSRQQVRPRTPALRGLRLWLRLSVVPSPRRRAADLPVRYLAVERSRRPDRGDRGGALLRGAV